MDISQLLLSGAKMTAQHCDKCGYPLFEKNGKLICANCTEEEQEQEKRSKNSILEEKWGELLTRLQQSKDLNETEHILRCLTLLKELI
ncbi:MAG: hypothetical protein HXS53_07465 [Theionarchaea archaeon]|nr:hypothetical protein [Theionarchaea archaeon]